MKADDRIACGRILNHFGLEAQASKTMKELKELAEVFEQIDSEGLNQSNLNALVGKIAAVEVLLEQIKSSLILHDVVAEMVHERVVRAQARIASDYYGS